MMIVKGTESGLRVLIVEPAGLAHLDLLFPYAV